MESEDQRYKDLDFIKGFVIALMVMDHTRTYTYSSGFNPLDIEKTHAFLFFYRWVTHLCAPLFVFLAGTSVYLYQQKNGLKLTQDYLIKRGLMLLFLALTLVKFGFLSGLNLTSLNMGIIWLFSLLMLLMSFLLSFSMRALASTSFLMIVSHNFFDAVSFSKGSFKNFLWLVLHKKGDFEVGGFTFKVLYPLVPWLGVFVLGYCAGCALKFDSKLRKFWSFLISLFMISGFFVMRTGFLYGEPNTWQQKDSSLKTYFSFVDLTKYPPSLLYMMLFMGLGFLLYYCCIGKEHKSWWQRALIDFGRVPMFCYIAHLYLLHALVAFLKAFNLIERYHSLVFSHLVFWICLVFLAPLSRKYWRLKKSSKYRLLKYI